MEVAFDVEVFFCTVGFAVVKADLGHAVGGQVGGVAGEVFVLLEFLFY